ncbi:MAG: hypothetical protein KIS78_21180 [Labilithrix sp.]|nr:hypothetical protein [Labilithrix sp.]MCW5834928.1 hypothetical protein [Labilithrix sp.]
MIWTPFARRLALGATSVATIFGCSDVVQSASPFSEREARCDLRPGKAQCTDVRKFKGPSLVTFQGVCGSLSAASQDATGYQEDATCPTAGMWGGCQTENGDGSLQTNWFYEGDEYKTEDDAKKECASSTTWVGPR